jgi:transposase
MSDRVYRCECGYVEDRDINAAKNILSAALN